MVGGSTEDTGGGASDGSGQLAPYSEEYWLKLWAFGTSTDGLGLSELSFWLLTYPEFVALKRQWEGARGIQPAPTKQQLADHTKIQRAILAAQVRVHNKQVEERRRKAEKAGMRVVEKVSNG